MTNHESEEKSSMPIPIKSTNGHQKSPEKECMAPWRKQESTCKSPSLSLVSVSITPMTSAVLPDTKCITDEKCQTVTESTAKNSGVCIDAKTKELSKPETADKDKDEPLVIICTEQNFDNMHHFERYDVFLYTKHLL